MAPLRTIRTANLISRDATISVPDAVQQQSDGTWLACHADCGDVSYPTLRALEAAYQIDVPERQNSIRVTVGGSVYDVRCLHDEVTIIRDGVMVGQGHWDAECGTIYDCAAVLGEDVYTALECALCDVFEPCPPTIRSL